jgi:hypothetical protein
MTRLPDSPERGNRFGINPLNLLSLKKVKRIVLNHNNQIKKAVLFFVLFHVLTANAQNSIEWDGTYQLQLTIFNQKPRKLAPRETLPVSILLQSLILDSS